MRLKPLNLSATIALFLLILPIESTRAQFTSSGTAFFVSSDGYILTADHIVKGKSKINILMDNKLIDASLIKEDEANDLALLKIDKSPVPFLKLGLTENIPIGTVIFTIGYPQLNIQGMSPKFTMGIINSDKGLKGNPRHFQFSAAIQKGSSGGPLIAPDNVVIGVVESKLNSLPNEKAGMEIFQNVNYALKTEFALDILKAVPSIPKPISINPKQEREPYEIFRDTRSAIIPVLAAP